MPSKNYVQPASWNTLPGITPLGRQAHQQGLKQLKNRRHFNKATKPSAGGFLMRHRETFVRLPISDGGTDAKFPRFIANATANPWQFSCVLSEQLGIAPRST